MYEKDKKKGRKKKGRTVVENLCAEHGGGKEKREISIRISRRREKAYLLVHVYIYTSFFIISYMKRTVL